MKKPIYWSFGAGTQSIAIALLIEEGKLPIPDRAIMADTGGEMTEVWDYKKKYIDPLLAKKGLEIEIAPHTLATVDMYGHNGDLLIPAYTKTGKLPTFCSKEWKAYVVRRYIGGHENNPDGVIMWLGMSTDEVWRMKPSGVQWIEHQWPLCDMPVASKYNIRMNRTECRNYILSKGYPDPPHSACVWCPHLDDTQWARMKKYSSSDFERAKKVQREIYNKDTKGGVWLHESRKNLDMIDFSLSQGKLFPDECETGYCEF
jgi:hypothetical protein